MNPGLRLENHEPIRMKPSAGENYDHYYQANNLNRAAEIAIGRAAELPQMEVS